MSEPVEQVRHPSPTTILAEEISAIAQRLYMRQEWHTSRELWNIAEALQDLQKTGGHVE